MRSAILLLTLLSALSLPRETLAENERISSHLEFVEELLQNRPPPVQRADLEQRRIAGLRALREYARAGEFPTNTGHAGGRQPYFIDDYGVPCAVAHIMIDSGHAALADEIRSTQNTLWLDEMRGPNLVAWVAQSGFSLNELRLIQPSYAYSPAYDDPLLEAAHLVNEKAFFDELAAHGPPANSPAYRARLTEGLRALAPIADWDDTPPPDRSVGVYNEPPPRKVNGRPFVKTLLRLGADPKAVGVDGHTIVYWTKDPDVRALLVAAGGRLSPVERALEAVDANDVTAIKQSLLDVPDANIEVVCHALSQAWGSNEHGTKTITTLNAVLDAKPFDLNAKCAAEPRALSPLRGIVSGSPRSLIKIARSVSAMEALIQHEYQPAESSEFESILTTYTHYTGGQSTNKTVEEFLVKHRHLMPQAVLDERLLRARQRSRQGASHTAEDLYVRLGASYSKVRVAEVLTRLPEKLTPEHYTDIRRIVEGGANLSSVYGLGPAIVHAALRGDRPLARFLLEHGASANQDEKAYCPVLAIAIERDDIAMAKLFRKFDADANAVYNAGLVSCVSPKKAGGYATRMQAISSMTMSAAMREAIALPRADIDLNALGIPPLPLEQASSAPDGKASEAPAESRSPARPSSSSCAATGKSSTGSLLLYLLMAFVLTRLRRVRRLH